MVEAWGIEPCMIPSIIRGRREKERGECVCVDTFDGWMDGAGRLREQYIYISMEEIINPNGIIIPSRDFFFHL